MDAFDRISLDSPDVKPIYKKNNGKGDAFDQLPTEPGFFQSVLNEMLFSKDKSPFEQGLQQTLEGAGKIPGFRTAAQVPIGLAEGSPYGIITNLLNFVGTGEAMSPETIDELRIAHERQGLPFDEEEYLNAVKKVSSQFPTPGNIASGVEESTDIPLDPSNRFEDFLRFSSMATKLVPKSGSAAAPSGMTFRGMETALPRPVLGGGVGATREGLKETPIPEPINDLLSFLVLKQAPAGASALSIGKKTKPSGLPERQFEKVTESTKIPEKKLQQINEKLETDFRTISDQIIKESPIGETADNLKNDPKFKQDSRELLNQAQEIADSIPGTLPIQGLKEQIADLSTKNVKGVSLGEYDKNYLKFAKEHIKSFVSDNITHGELVEQYRKNNRSLGEYFEPGSSKALNRAKRDALLDYNRAIAAVLEKTNPELSAVFKEGNSRWSRIMDAEAIDDFVGDIFSGKVNYKKLHDFFDKTGYDRIFKRALGEEGYKNFEQLVEDMLTSERSYKMLHAAKAQGWEDLFKTGLGYIIHPKIGYAKAGYDAVKYSYRGLMNALIDKPQLGFTFKKAVNELKKGDFAAAEKDFQALQSEIEVLPREEAPKAKAEPETVEVTPEKAEQKETFITEKGSVYEVNEDGTTTRNKAFRPEHGEKEVGIQPKSEKTWYVTKEDANKLGEFQAKGEDKRLVQLHGDTLGIIYESGKDAGKVEARTIIDAKTKPVEGLIPVEIFDEGKKVHFGNKIVKVKKAPAEKPEGKILPKEATHKTSEKSKTLDITPKKAEKTKQLEHKNFKEPSSSIENLEIKTIPEKSRSRFSFSKDASDEKGNVVASLSYDVEPTGEVYISSIDVDKPYQRKGIAKKLLADLLKQHGDKEFLISPMQPDGAKFFSKVFEKDFLPSLTEDLKRIPGTKQESIKLTKRDIEIAKKNLKRIKQD